MRIQHHHTTSEYIYIGFEEDTFRLRDELTDCFGVYLSIRRELRDTMKHQSPVKTLKSGLLNNRRVVRSHKDSELRTNPLQEFILRRDSEPAQNGCIVSANHSNL